MLCYCGDDMEEYRRWEGNIKMDPKEIDVDVMNWMRLSHFSVTLSAPYEHRLW